MLSDPKEDYARGFVPFLGQKIFLDSRPLIPRTETEYWVEKAIREIKGDEGVRVVDLFAGSGCIGIAILAHVPGAHVTFAEKEKRHLPVIEKSIWENGIAPARARVAQSDVWSGVTGRFTYIFANPPYVSKVRTTLEPSVATHEPEEALFAEDDGFALIQKTIEGLSEHLAHNGALWIEHEPFHTPRLLFEAAARSMSATTFPDQYQTLRYSKITVA